MHSIAWWPTVAVVLAATYTDIRSRRIPNWLALPFLALGVAVLTGLHGWRGLGQSLSGAGLAVLLFGLLFCLGGMGGGDVKLCAAIGAWVGPSQMLLALVMIGLAGGVMALCWAVYKGFLRNLFSSLADVLFVWTKNGQVTKRLPTLADAHAHKMPYAPAIAIGTLLSFFAH
jgi:prepilin peptidase CpaA